jgi:hypothetical protein
MKLVRIAKGRWDVVAVVNQEGRCEVLDLLDGADAGYAAARRFLSVCLRVYLPLEGPPVCNNRLCKPLGDGIFELRRPEGPKPKVLFFRDDKGRIVCTNAFGETKLTAGKEVLLARNLRDRYFEENPEIAAEALDSALTRGLT